MPYIRQRLDITLCFFKEGIFLRMLCENEGKSTQGRKVKIFIAMKVMYERI